VAGKEVEKPTNALGLSNICDENEVEKDFGTVYRLHLR